MAGCSKLLARIQVLGLAALGLLGAPAIALAHGVTIQSRTTAAVEIQATFEGGEAMANAQVQVFAPEDLQSPIFTGITDAEGKYLFTPSSAGDWEVVVRQAGHGDVIVIPVSEQGAVTTSFTNSTGLTGLQRGIVAIAVAWGCVGTALYFRRGKQ